MFNFPGHKLRAQAMAMAKSPLPYLHYLIPITHYQITENIKIQNYPIWASGQGLAPGPGAWALAKAQWPQALGQSTMATSFAKGR